MKGIQIQYVYVDFGESYKSLSREIARQCTSRDIQELSQFFTSNVFLRTLNLIAANNPRYLLEYDKCEPCEYMLSLLNLKKTPSFRQQLIYIIESI